MARILLHTLVFAPDGVSTAYLMTDLARQLRGLGHRITVLTTTPHYNRDETTLSRHECRTVVPGLLYRSTCDGIPVWHIKMPRKGARVGARLLDYVRFHALSILATAFVGRYDVVLAPSPPLTIGIASWLLGLLRHVPSIYNVQELYPDFAVNQGFVRNPRAIRLLSVIERTVYAKNAAIVPITDGFKDAILRRGCPARKVQVIPNFVDTEFYRPLPRHNVFSRIHALDDIFVVLYAGNIGLSQDWESFLHAAREATDRRIRFVVVGDGARREWLASEVSRRKLANVILPGYQPLDLMPYVHAASDVCVVPMKASAALDTFPSKIFTIMASGRFVIASAEHASELRAIIEVSGSGRVVPPGDPAAFSRAVLEAYMSWGAGDIVGARGRALVERLYSKEAIGRKYDLLIRKVAKNQ